jgi:multiple sugar transport system substrate-binding protein
MKRTIYYLATCCVSLLAQAAPTEIIFWDFRGHIPAYLPLQESDAYKQMSPNNQYSAGAAKNVVFDPPLPLFGVGSPSFGAISNFLIPVLNGQMPADQGLQKFTGELEKFAKEQQ